MYVLLIIILLYCFILVDPDEIKRLSKRFRRLDLNKDGSLSLDEFMTIPELQQNPLVKRVIDILDTDRNGSIDFQGIVSLVMEAVYVRIIEFIEGVSQFSVRGDKDKKLKCKRGLDICNL